MIGLFLTAMTAYVLYRPDFKYRHFFTVMFYITGVFTGGLTANYLWITDALKMRDTFGVLLFPLLLSPWHIIVMRSFMKAIPMEIVEAARVDGANDFHIFTKVVLPLMAPGVAVIGLFIALSYWNDWKNASLYITNSSLYPIQYYLYRMTDVLGLMLDSLWRGGIGMFAPPAQSVKMAMAVVAALPAFVLYPMVHRYVLKGIMVGSIKS